MATGSLLGTRRAIDDVLAVADAVPRQPAVELTTNAAVIAAVRAGGPPTFVSNIAQSLRWWPLTSSSLPTNGPDLRRRFTAVRVGASRLPRSPVRDLLQIASLRH